MDGRDCQDLDWGSEWHQAQRRALAREIERIENELGELRRVLDRTDRTDRTDMKLQRKAER